MEPKDNCETKIEGTDDNKNASCVNEETHDIVNSHDIKLKEEEEISNTKDCGDLKGDENTRIHDERDGDFLKDDKDSLKNLEADDGGDRNIDTNEIEVPKDSKSQTIEKMKENDSIDDLDTKDKIEDNKDIEEKDVFSGDEKVFKRYRFRQRQSICYRLDEPPPKRKKVNEDKNDNVTDYDCPICYDTYTSKRSLSMHMVFHEQPEKFTCAQCTMEFLTNKELVDHKKVHEADTTIFSCGRCKVAYSNMLEYLLHMANHNKSESKFNCEECGRVFSNRHLYKIHLPTHFTSSFACNICQKKLKSRYHYKEHMRGHGNNRNHKCGECDKVCNSKKHYDYHMATHTGVKLYQCLYCGKGFACNSQRKVHTRIHTGERPFKCDICMKTFKQTTDQQRHMFHHNPVKLKYICDHCGKEYSHKPTLAIHMRLHTRQNLLSCPVCNKKFPLHALLKSHYIYQHTDEKPYKCDTCNVSFKRLTHLQRHLKVRKHNNAVYGLELKKKLKLQENRE